MKEKEIVSIKPKDSFLWQELPLFSEEDGNWEFPREKPKEKWLGVVHGIYMGGFLKPKIFFFGNIWYQLYITSTSDFVCMYKILGIKFYLEIGK